MKPPTVYSVKGQLYLEEGAEITELCPLDDVARRNRAKGWIQFLLGCLFGFVVAVARLYLQ